MARQAHESFNLPLTVTPSELKTLFEGNHEVANFDHLKRFVCTGLMNNGDLLETKRFFTDEMRKWTINNSRKEEFWTIDVQILDRDSSEIWDTERSVEHQLTFIVPREGFNMFIAVFKM